MSKVAGKSGKVDISGTVAGIKNWSLDYTGEALDTTDFESSGAKEFLAGLTEWSGSFEGNFAEEAPETVGGSVTLKLYVDETYYIEGTALITGWHPATTVDGLVTMSYDYQGTGALTLSNLVA